LSGRATGNWRGTAMKEREREREGGARELKNEVADWE